MTGDMILIFIGLAILAFGAVLSIAVVTWAKDRMWVWPVALITAVLTVNENLPDGLRLAIGLIGVAVTEWALLSGASDPSRWRERKPGRTLILMQVWAILGVVWFGWLLFNNWTNSL